MLPSADIITVNPVAPSARLSRLEGLGGARQEAFQRSLQTMLGQSMRGTVLSRMNDGSFLVKVAGTSARMLLPSGAQVGSEVPLTLVAIDPRPTFQVATGRAPGATVTLSQADAGAATAQGARATGLKAAALPGLAQLTPAELLAEPGPGGPAPDLSNAARAIASVLTQAASVPGAPLALVGQTPLLTPPAGDPAQLARALRDTVATSGLFYESHVAEWAEGKRGLPELLREPQMGAARAAAGGADPAAAQLINLQLHVQEQARVAWQGEAWPGQKLEWEISRDAPEHGHGGEARDDDAPAPWRSGMRFEFPALGALSASITLIGDQLHIALRADSEDSAAALRARAGALEQALAAAGASLASLSIGQGGGDVD